MGFPFDTPVRVAALALQLAIPAALRPQPASRPTAAAPGPCLAGTAALERRDLETAERLLLRCRAANPGRLESYVALAALYQLQGHDDSLHRTALEGLRRFPGEKRFYLTVGNRAGRDKRYARAIEVFAEGVRRWPNDARLRSGLSGAHAELGMKLLDDGDNTRAERELRRAIALDENDVEAHLNLGRALYNLNHITTALAEFDRVVALAPELARAHFHRSMALSALGEYERAIADLDREIALNPTFPPSYLSRGLARIALGEWESALADLETAARRMPETARAQFALGRCLARLGRGAEAEAAFRAAIGLDAADPAPLNALARLLLGAGRVAEAEDLTRRAADLERTQRRAAPGEIRFDPARAPKPR